MSRGFLKYRNGLATAQPIEAGHRIGVIVQGPNTVWAVRDDPGATYTFTGSALELPLS